MIEDLMFNYIDQKIMHNPLAIQYIQDKNFRGLLVEAAKACIGIHELTGHNDGILVNSIQRSIDGKVSVDEYWCMDGVQTARLYVEKKIGIISPLLYTQGCQNLWDHTMKHFPDLIVKGIPEPADVAYWRHANGGGHTGIVISSNGVVTHYIEFNATGSLTPIADMQSHVDRNGNGCYYTIRSAHDKELIGHIKPIAA